MGRQVDCPFLLEIMKNQKGFIPILFIIIGAVVVASATLGVIYKDKITASVFEVLKKPKSETPIISPMEENELIEEIEEPETISKSELKEDRPIYVPLSKSERINPKVQPESQNQEVAQKHPLTEEEKVKLLNESLDKDIVKGFGQNYIKTQMQLLDQEVNFTINNTLSLLSDVKSFANELYANEKYGISDAYHQSLINYLKASEDFLSSYRNFWNAFKQEIINLAMSYPIPTIEKSDDFKPMADKVDKDFDELWNGVDENWKKDKTKLDEIYAELRKIQNDLIDIPYQYVKGITE